MELVRLVGRHRPEVPLPQSQLGAGAKGTARLISYHVWENSAPSASCPGFAKGGADAAERTERWANSSNDPPGRGTGSRESSGSRDR